jgi:hypothetical protein
MRRDDPNLGYLLVIANALGDLRDEVVFVGGSVAGLLLTDPLAEGVRATKDVDAIVEAASLREYYEVEKRLPALGFSRDIVSEVICRWTHRTTGVLFDLMPTDPAILGFSNTWYPEAVKTAARVQLSDGVEIRVISGAAFVATKLEASWPRRYPFEPRFGRHSQRSRWSSFDCRGSRRRFSLFTCLCQRSRQGSAGSPRFRQLFARPPGRGGSSGNSIIATQAHSSMSHPSDRVFSTNSAVSL